MKISLRLARLSVPGRAGRLDWLNWAEQRMNRAASEARLLGSNLDFLDLWVLALLPQVTFAGRGTARRYEDGRPQIKFENQEHLHHDRDFKGSKTGQ